MLKRFGTFDVERQDGLNIPRAKLAYPSKFETILLCLESVFTSEAQLAKAEAMIEQALSKLESTLL